MEERRFIYLYIDGEIEWITSFFQDIVVVKKLFHKSNYIFIFKKKDISSGI